MHSVLPVFVMLFPLLALLHSFGATGSCSVCLCSGKTSYVVFRLARWLCVLLSRWMSELFWLYARFIKKLLFVVLFKKNLEQQNWFELAFELCWHDLAILQAPQGLWLSVKFPFSPQTVFGRLVTAFSFLLRNKNKKHTVLKCFFFRAGRRRRSMEAVRLWKDSVRWTKSTLVEWQSAVVGWLCGWLVVGGGGEKRFPQPWLGFWLMFHLSSCSDPVHADVFFLLLRLLLWRNRGCLSGG